MIIFVNVEEIDVETYFSNLLVQKMTASDCKILLTKITQRQLINIKHTKTIAYITKSTRLT